MCSPCAHGEHTAGRSGAAGGAGAGVVEAGEGCDSATFGTATTAAHGDVHSLQCGQLHNDIDGKQVGVCSAAASCIDVPVANGAQITASHCECVTPAYPNPELAAAYAPYEVIGGCLEPRRQQELVYTSTGVQASLQKPHYVSVSLNLTLRLTGTDRAATMWRVTNADVLDSWMQLPHAAANISDDAQVVQIAITLTASGRRERAQAYTETLIVAVSSYAFESVTKVCASQRSVHTLLTLEPRKALSCLSL